MKYRCVPLSLFSPFSNADPNIKQKASYENISMFV